MTDYTWFYKMDIGIYIPFFNWLQNDPIGILMVLFRWLNYSYSQVYNGRNYN